jgi:hypothetical protein
MLCCAACPALQYNVPAETLDTVVFPLLSNTTTTNSSSSSSSSNPQPMRHHSKVVLLKLDVEGHEPEALAGAAQLLGGQLVDNVLLEYGPHVAEMHK